MSDDSLFLAGVAQIRAFIAAQLKVAGATAEQLNVLPVDDGQPSHQLIFNVYANARARSISVTQTKVFESANGVHDIELLRDIADLVKQLT